MRQDANKNRTGLWGWAPAVLCFAILVGVGVDTYSHPRPGDAEPYHQKVRALGDALPKRIGGWEGTDLKVPEAAITLLQPNFIVSRAYENKARKQVVQLLFVHCRNARDLAGHFPPVCYPANGRELVKSRPWDMSVGDLAIHGMRYEFAGASFSGAPYMLFYNFLIMPDGRIVRDMQAVYEAAGSFLRYFHGAGQVQLVFTDPAIIEADREEAMREIVGACGSVIQAIREGPKQ
jgi:hypothetical protein